MLEWLLDRRGGPITPETLRGYWGMEQWCRRRSDLSFSVLLSLSLSLLEAYSLRGLLWRWTSGADVCAVDVHDALLGVLRVEG